MCGICGILNVREHPSPKEIEAMLCRLTHRGPDHQAYYCDGPVALGHTRLSIIDLSEAGNQPMRTDDGRFVISYNGEIYNFRELKKDLDAHLFHSHSDTEVVLHSFRKNGVRCFGGFNGMFAFALYDTVERKLWLVRDRFGVKPLYYLTDGDSIRFASELSAITATIRNAPQCRLSAVHEWLYYGNTLGEKTLFENIFKLLPGHYAEIDCMSMRCVIHRYWDPVDTINRNGYTAVQSDVYEETCRLLENAVKRQLVSDVPVCVYLSGGIDSGAITAFAAKHYNGKLATYTAAFDYDKCQDELAYARITAKAFATDHHEVRISGYDVGDIVTKLVEHHGMPFSDAANIPLYLLSTQVNKSVKVILQGDGGDELFCGYQRYTSLYYYNFLRLVAPTAKGINGLLPRNNAYYRRLRYLNIFSQSDRALTLALLLTEEDPRQNPATVFGEDFRKTIVEYDPFERYRECFDHFRKCDLINQMSFTDCMVIQPDIFFEKVDRSTMAASIEARVPFLDNDLFDHCLRLSGRRKVPLGRKKWLLKKSLKGILPETILTGKKKGFGVPYGYWLKSSLYQQFRENVEVFSEHCPGILDTAGILAMLDEHRTGSRERPFLLWKIFNFILWANMFKVSFRQ